MPVLRRPGSGAFEHQWFLGWVLRHDASASPPSATVLWPEGALQAAYSSALPAPSAAAAPVPSVEGRAERVVSLLSDDVARVGTWLRGAALLRFQQLAPRAADAVAVPPPPPCLPYTEAGNDALLSLLRRDAEQPPSRRFCLQ